MLRGFEASRLRCLVTWQIFTTTMKTCYRNIKHVAQIMSDTAKYHHDVVGCIKMSRIENRSVIYQQYIEALSYIYRTSIERLSNIYQASIGMPNLVRAKTRRQLRGDPTAGMWRRKSWRGSGRRSCRPSFGSGRRSRRRRRWGIAWILFLAAWQGCADGDVIVRCWETAKDVRYSRSMFIGRRMVDRFSIYRQTEVR